LAPQWGHYFLIKNMGVMREDDLKVEEKIPIMMEELEAEKEENFVNLLVRIIVDATIRELNEKSNQVP